MRAPRSLYLLVALTLLDVGWSLVGATLGADLLAAGPFAVGAYALVGALGVVLAPVFFVALYVDAGVVREDPSPWTPDRRLWVGGGALVVLFAYVAFHSLAVGVVGLAYLLRRAHAVAHRDVDAVVGPTRQARDEDDELPAERSAAGVAVHLLALPTAGVGAALVYALSDHPFTRANARHALNWYLSVAVFTAVAHLTLVAGSDEGSILGYATTGPLVPAPLDAVVGLLGVFLVALSVLSWGLTVAFALAATVKAALGTPWGYPLAGAFVERVV